MLKSLLLAASEQPPFDPATLLEEVNRRFAVTVLPGHFASMFLARWNPQRHELTWAGAGHLPGTLLSKSGGLEALRSTGLLLGVDADSVWKQRQITLTAGDRILLFTDGVTETRNPDGELFGTERLSAWFSRFSDLQPQDFVARIHAILSDHRGECCPSDDLTLVILECVTSHHRDEYVICDEESSRLIGSVQ
jgi:serine phosphatase RsbU (regulator of sigma subunit)